MNMPAQCVFLAFYRQIDRLLLQVNCHCEKFKFKHTKKTTKWWNRCFIVADDMVLFFFIFQILMTFHTACWQSYYNTQSKAKISHWIRFQRCSHTFWHSQNAINVYMQLSLSISNIPLRKIQNTLQYSSSFLLQISRKIFRHDFHRK